MLLVAVDGVVLVLSEITTATVTNESPAMLRNLVLLSRCNTEV
ncbi:hypothetical protein [Photobacterium damselae]|nr:hypothetical protein [Photobacterium damselae]